MGQPFWVGQYRLTSRIATGGMAEVYVGRQISPAGEFGPMVALKRLLPHLVKDSTIVRMFLNEARITAQINHPNVVKIYELGETDGEPFIAMELLEGRTWAELRTRAAEDARRMPSGVALRILADACRGLDAAHRAVGEDGQPLALVHRDFTPDNIHVGVQGDIKVIDFGVARTSSWGAGTEPGTLKGKFFYMSPEMILAKPVDHRADIFAAGVMLYEQLCGRRPFTGASIDEIVLRIAREEPPAPSSYDPAVPKALDALCARALAKEPANRFQSLAQFVEALENVGGDSMLAAPQQVGEYVSAIFPPTDARRDTLRRARAASPSVPGTLKAVEEPPAPPPPPPPAPAPAPREEVKTGGRRFLIAGLLTVVLLALAGGGYVLSQRTPPTATELLEKAKEETGADQARTLVKLGAAPDVTEAQLKQAAALLTKSASWEAALELGRAWSQKNPKSFDARLLEGTAAVETKKAKSAEAALLEASQLAPKDARPDLLLASLREAQGDAAGALDAWSRAVAKAPANTQALARQGYWLSQAGRLEEAESPLTKAAKRGDAGAQAELGFVKYRREQFDEALRLLRAVVKEHPKLYEGHYYLAPVLFRKRDVAGARAAYLAADALKPDDVRALTGLCEMEAMAGGGHLDEVKQKLKQRFPKEADALISRCAP